MSAPADVWAAGNAYEPYVGRWSRVVAREFLEWLAPANGERWLDVGCGTGALTEAILEIAAPARVDAVDASAAYVEFARDRIRDSRVVFDVADARTLPTPSASVDIVVSGLVLNFVPEPETALREMARVVRPGGHVAVYLWDYAGEMQLMRHFWDAAAELDARAAALDEGRRFPICQLAPLETLFRNAGLQKVEGRAIDAPTRFRDFSDYWTPFLGGQGPAPTYAMSLTEDQRTTLRERLRARLSTAPDGSIDLIARAWAVRGERK
ncbi:MAG: methyltransferase domain-containing protein [bacterium]